MLNTQLKLNKLSQVSRTNVLSSGFTLIELLVVIVILAILAVAVIVAINPAQRIAASNNARTKSDLSSFGSAAGIYDTDNDTYPNGFGGTGLNVSTGVAAPAWSVAAGARDASGVAYAFTPKPAGCGAASQCTDLSISGSAVTDGSSYNGTVVATGMAWCYRSVTGQVTLVANAAACTP